MEFITKKIDRLIWDKKIILIKKIKEKFYDLNLT